MPQQPDDIDRLLEHFKTDAWRNPLGDMSEEEIRRYADSYFEAFPHLKPDMATRKGRRKAREEANPTDPSRCLCEPYWEFMGGATPDRLMLEYEPSCPIHSMHLYDPRQDIWVLPEGPDVLDQAADEFSKSTLLRARDRDKVVRWLNKRARKLRYPEPKE